MKEALKISGILNIAFSSIYFLLMGFGIWWFFPIFVFLLVSGIVYLNTSIEYWEDKRNILLILSIINIPLLLVSGLIIFINTYKMIKKHSRAPDIDPETKRIDILIKIGLTLISLSGIIFVLSGWNSLNGYIVIIFLAIFSFIFYLLHLLFTYKINLNDSKKLYYILFNIFVGLLYLAFGYYKIFGNYFCIGGSGNYLFYTTLFILITLLIYGLKKITNSNIRIYFMFIFSTLSLYNLFLFIGFSYVQSLVMINILVIFIKFKLNNKLLVNYSNLLMHLFIVLTLYCFTFGYSISLLIMVIVNIFVINYYNISKSNILYQIFTPLVTILYSGIIIGLFVNNIHSSLDMFILLYLSFLSIIYIILMFLNINKNITKIIFVIVYNLILFVLNIMSLVINGYLLVFIIVLHLVTIFSIIYKQLKKKDNSLEIYLVLNNLILLPLSILVYLNTYISIGFSEVLLSIMLMLSIYYYVINNKVLNITILIIVFILNVINVLISNISSNEVVVSLTLISTIIPFVLYVSKFKENTILTYIYCLLSSYIVLLNDIYDYLSSFIICMVLYLILYVITRKDKLFSKYTIMFSLLPLITFVIRLDLNIDVIIMLVNMILFVYIVYFIYNFIKKENIELKCTLFIIFTLILFLSILFNSNYIFGIYIGIVTLVLIIYSSLKDELKSIFIYSLILFIINILFRLRDMWSSIPLWGYLLFAGLSIIVFATIKEIKRSKK